MQFCSSSNKSKKSFDWLNFLSCVLIHLLTTYFTVAQTANLSFFFWSNLHVQNDHWSWELGTTQNPKKQSSVRFLSFLLIFTGSCTINLSSVVRQRINGRWKLCLCDLKRWVCHLPIESPGVFWPLQHTLHSTFALLLLALKFPSLHYLVLLFYSCIADLMKCTIPFPLFSVLCDSTCSHI